MLFFEKVHNIDKPLTRLIMKKRIQINKIRNKRGEITINITDIRKVISEYYEQLYAPNNLEKWTNFQKQLSKMETGKNRQLDQKKKRENRPIISNGN